MAALRGRPFFGGTKVFLILPNRNFLFLAVFCKAVPGSNPFREGAIPHHCRGHWQASEPAGCQLSISREEADAHFGFLGALAALDIPSIIPGVECTAPGAPRMAAYALLADRGYGAAVYRIYDTNPVKLRPHGQLKSSIYDKIEEANGLLRSVPQETRRSFAATYRTRGGNRKDYGIPNWALQSLA